MASYSLEPSSCGSNKAAHLFNLLNTPLGNTRSAYTEKMPSGFPSNPALSHSQRLPEAEREQATSSREPSAPAHSLYFGPGSSPRLVCHLSSLQTQP